MYYSKEYVEMCEKSKEIQQMHSIKRVCSGIAPYHHYRACKKYFCIGLCIGDYVYIKNHSYYCERSKKYKKTHKRTFGYVTEFYSPAKYIDDEDNWYPSCSISINSGWGDSYDSDICTMNFGISIESKHILIRNFNCTYKSQVIWLPRQDQITAICCKLGKVDFVTLIKDITKDISDNKIYLKEINHNSGEQVTLSFLMYNFYNKIWNGEQWL